MHRSSLRAIRPYLEELSLNESGDYSITLMVVCAKNDTGEIMEKAALQLADIHELLLSQQNWICRWMSYPKKSFCALPTSATNQSIYGSLNPLLDCRPYAIEALDESKLYNKAVIAYHQEVLIRRFWQFLQQSERNMK